MRRIFLLLFFLFLISVSLISSPAAHAAAVHEQAPDFELPDRQGVLHRLSDLRGKVIVINFWATWCPECVREMPSLNALYDRMKKEGLAVLGVSIDRDWDEIDTRLKNPAITYPVLMDKKGEVFVKKYTVTRLPATIIIGRDGSIVQRLFGPQDFDSSSFAGKVKELLKEGEKK